MAISIDITGRAAKSFFDQMQDSKKLASTTYAARSEREAEERLDQGVEDVRKRAGRQRLHEERRITDHSAVIT
jgi:hypothetical protein